LEAVLQWYLLSDRTLLCYGLLFSEFLRGLLFDRGTRINERKSTKSPVRRGPVSSMDSYGLFFLPISTQMADSRNFSYESQRDLARIFTLIMAAGVLASLVVGVLMDRIGLDACTALTLLLGQGQILILVFVPDHRRWMIFGFVVYVFFRQFLFPVYIANLTAHLGFKYFGLLNGLGFAASGIAQVFMASLVQVVQGDCNMVSTDPGEDTQTVDCEIGRWMDLHVVEFVVMGLLLLAPWIESREKLRRQERIQELLRIASQTSMSYGSVSPSPSNLDDHARVGMEL
jgi:MFS family permease